MAKAASHTGRHIPEYVKSLAEKLAKIREQYLAAKKAVDATTSKEARKAAMKEAKEAAAKAIEATQDEIRKGLENGTIALQKAEAEGLPGAN